MEFERKPLSLLELCVRTVIDNLRYVGSMDGVEMQLLERILPHCTLDQLTRIESCTEMDISPVTDELWKRFYQRQFGEDNTNLVVKKMKQNRVHYKWKDLFKAKTEKQKEVEDMMIERLTKKYQAEKASVAYEPCTYQEGNWHPRVATDHVRGTCVSLPSQVEVQGTSCYSRFSAVSWSRL